jgi:hypothetical protein
MALKSTGGTLESAIGNVISQASRVVSVAAHVSLLYGSVMCEKITDLAMMGSTSKIEQSEPTLVASAGMKRTRSSFIRYEANE